MIHGAVAHYPDQQPPPRRWTWWNATRCRTRLLPCARGPLPAPRVRLHLPREAPAPAPLLVEYASHLPVFVEISVKVFPKGAAEVHAAGSRVLTNAFVADVGVSTGDDRKVYLGFFDSGADALQTELPDELLKSLGRL